MATQEYRRVVNQGMIVPEQDRAFAEVMRRLLLKVVSMIEDRYGLTPVSRKREEERVTRSLR